MATTTKTVFLTDENGNLLVDSNGRPRALTFTVIEGKSLRLAERETIPTVTYAELKTYSESVQTYTGITNTARFSVEDVAVFQYIVSDRGNTRAYITAQVSAVNDTSLTANGIGISVAGADGKNGATPEIGANGNWYINGEDTGKPSKGAKGDDGKSVTSATAGTVSEADGYTVTPVTFGLSDGSSLPAVSVKAKNAESEIIDFGEQEAGRTFSVTSEQLEKMKSNNPPLVKVRLTKVFEYYTYEFTLSRLALFSNAAYYGGAFATDDKAFAVGMDAHGTSAFFEVREISESGGTPVIDLGEVTLSTMSSGAISHSFADGIQVTLEQAAMAQSEIAPIVKIRFDNTDHEFFRTKISTDASAAYILFTATEDMGEGTQFYNLQITVSESGGASAMLMVWKYKILEGLNSTYEVRGLSFVEGVSTITITEEEKAIFNEGGYNQIRFWDNSNTNEIYILYLSHSNRGASGINSHKCDYFGIVENASVTGEGGGITAFAAYLDDTTLTIKQVAIGSGSGGGGLAQNEIINREASIDIANEESPDFVENSTELYAKQTIKASISILSEELEFGRISAPAVTANNGKIYIFGGFSNYEYSDEIIEYDYNEKTIKTLSAKLPSARSQVAAAIANNGNIYIFGGYVSANGTFFSDICRFNIDTQKVTVVGSFDTGARDIAAVTANNGYIYLFGGERGTSGIVAEPEYTNKILKFSPETETYITIGATLPFENYCTAVNSTNGKIYIFPRYGNEIYEFDPELEIITKTISITDSMNSIIPSWYLSYAANGLNEKIYIFAETNTYANFADRFLEFDPKTESLNISATILPVAKRDSAVATGLDGIIYIIGGDDSTEILAFNSGKINYKKYTDGKDGTTPHIGENKHWYIGEEDTGIVAEGKDGATPEIGENGNWFINGEDTGKSSKGADGNEITGANTGEIVDEEGYTITPIEFVFSDGSKTESVGVKAKHGANGTDAQVTKQKIAEVLNCTTADLDTIIKLAKIILVNGSDVTLTGNIIATGKITGSDINTTT